MREAVPINTRTGRSWRPRFPRWRRPDFGLVVALMPLATILIMASLTALLVWLADGRERAERAEALIRDALWVEQALRFQVGSVEETLERLAADVGAATLRPAEIGARLRAVLAGHGELARVEWRPAGAGAVIAAPEADERDAAVAARVAAALAFGRTRYAAPTRLGDGHAVEMIVPVAMADASAAAGALRAVILLDRLVAHHVPWWITQMNAVTLVDRDGMVLAAKSALAAPVDPVDRHMISLDPPFPGVLIAVTRRAAPSGVASNALVVAIFALSGVAVLSVFALQRHWRRRLVAETDLKEAHAFRKAMEESLTIGMRARDLDGRIIYVNPAFCRMVGLAPNQLIGLAPPQPYWVPELVPETMARHEQLGAGAPKAKSFETRFRHLPDGREFDILVYEAPLIDAQGYHRGWMGSIIDLTERKAAEAKERQQAETLQRVGRLTAMGEMASTIAHELNQPLAAIASYAAGTLNRLKADTLSPEDLAAALEKLDEQAQRAGRVLRRVHDFVRKREPVFGPLALGAVLDDLTAFLAPVAAKAGVTLAVTVPADLPQIAADRILIEQVLLNLARNAVEAMAATPKPERRLSIAAHAAAGHLVIAVADRGPGLDPAVRARLFQPFVSTKPEGMGMGLNICRSIVELHQGRLEVAERPEGGTVFTVTLPLLGPAAGAARRLEATA